VSIGSRRTRRPVAAKIALVTEIDRGGQVFRVGASCWPREIVDRLDGMKLARPIQAVALLICARTDRRNRMSEELERLLEAARRRHLTAEESEEQRRSFAYGTAKIENDRVTREIVDEQAETLRKTE
jgi:hypothetical protein